MENASKALLMAGGVLIAVLIIGLFTYMLTNSSSMFQTEADVAKAKEIEEYNKQYDSYNRKLLRGTDLISLMNKVVSNNKKYNNEQEYQVKFEIILQEPNETQEFSNENSTIYGAIKTNKENFDNFKRKVFDCNEVKYNEFGRIKEMIFQERKIYDEDVNI